MSSTALALVIAGAVIASVVVLVGGLCVVYLNEQRVRSTRPGRGLFGVLDWIGRLLAKIPWF
ncbi:hypothetical protein JVX90_15225 [Gordonia sp. PDNC005]|uniref:hypothetical protein n=1 Tax=unclassified Gordonia (in: high G+C Gram-positive bacteria) TaxID=2657482 RepID=UPI0019669062|nr:hypothetical protein [Gordonia sp. PDNC005]QRY61746.1 hypothetical protein JVX90_15225 [Gordonia sp. PDNC005]